MQLFQFSLMHYYEILLSSLSFWVDTPSLLKDVSCFHWPAGVKLSTRVKTKERVLVGFGLLCLPWDWDIHFCQHSEEKQKLWGMAGCHWQSERRWIIWFSIQTEFIDAGGNWSKRLGRTFGKQLAEERQREAHQGESRSGCSCGGFERRPLLAALRWKRTKFSHFCSVQVERHFCPCPLWISKYSISNPIFLFASCILLIKY